MEKQQVAEANKLKFRLTLLLTFPHPDESDEEDKDNVGFTITFLCHYVLLND
jgi:hypothetical protein